MKQDFFEHRLTHAEVLAQKYSYMNSFGLSVRDVCDDNFMVVLAIGLSIVRMAAIYELHTTALQ